MKRTFLLSAISFVAVWLFLWLKFPQALGFREQNQLFLFTADFFLERISVAGGLADWISEFITQFNVMPSLGAALIALLLTLLQVEIYFLTGCRKDAISYSLSFIPSLLILLHLGDIYVTLSFPVAIAIVLAFCILYNRKRSRILALAAIPSLMWLTGPVTWVFVLQVILTEKNLRSIFYALWAALCVLIQQYLILPQYPLQQTILGINYYALPLVHPVFGHIITATVIAVPFLCRTLPLTVKGEAVIGMVSFIIFFGATYAASFKKYDKDTYEILAYDQFIRNEKWNEVIQRAEKYQPKSEIGCVSINLALFITGQYDRVGDFRQYGTRGLLMPRVRDYISNISTGEAFWRIGMVNEALRYAFDTQEAIPNLRKSPRSLMRMAQCQIVNGRYEVASKYLDILSHTLFYRKWAEEQKGFLFNDDKRSSDSVYRYLLAVRQDEDYLYFYPQMDKMLGKLYFHNRNNIMAAWYYQVWTKLEKNDEEIDSYSVHGD